MGHDVLTIQQTGKVEQSLRDEEVLNEASKVQRTVLTFNRKHFIKLHGLQPEHNGIIVCTFDIDFLSSAKRIHEAIESHKSLSGELMRINRPAPEGPK